MEIGLTLAHDLIDLAVLLSTDKLLVLICKLDLDAHLVLASLHKWNLVDNHHCGFHCVVRPIDGKSEIVKADFGARIGADVRQHCADVRGRRSAEAALGRVRHDDPP